jgi:hypothetical protein
MSKAVVKLDWNNATHESGIKLYNVYQDNILIYQTTDTKYNVYDVEKPKTFSFFVVALSYSGDYLKSNIITVLTKDIAGFKSLNYTLNFSI